MRFIDVNSLIQRKQILMLKCKHFPFPLLLFSFLCITNSISITSRYCKQCSSPLQPTTTTTPPIFTCTLCNDTYCNHCISTPPSHPNGISGEWICDHCCEHVRPSWGEYPYCIGCSLDLSDKEIASSACVKCKKCKALFHTRCASAPVKDRRNWVCKDCTRLGNLVGRVIIDPTSRVLQCCYSEETSVN